MTTHDSILPEPFNDDTPERLDELQQTLDYKFNNIRLLVQALTHKSFAHENDQENNERLEFLGDAILQFVMSDHLMTNYPDLPEGMLSKFRAVLVSEKGLSKLAQKINLGQYLFIGKGEEITGGRAKSSILSDALEALFSAVYLDSKKVKGVEIVASLIKNLFAEEIEKAEETFASVDYKTDFQEYVQKNKLGTLTYKVIEERGPDHDKEFVTALIVGDQVYGVGTGKSKKTSEQHAAIDAFRKLRNKDVG
ncbi:MAG: ribonuclease III [Proteobacteria bacterium]|nr:ribonuclease III [Pseudomonadota bacterium]